MTNKKILKLTLEEYGYELDKLIYPVDGLVMAISEAMDRARIDQCNKVIKNNIWWKHPMQFNIGKSQRRTYNFKVDQWLVI